MSENNILIFQGPIGSIYTMFHFNDVYIDIRLDFKDVLKST